MTGTGRYEPLDVFHREVTKVLFGQNNPEGLPIRPGFWPVYPTETYSQPNTEQECMEILHDIIRGQQADRLQASYVVFCLPKAMLQVRSLSATSGKMTKAIMGWFDTCLQARPNIVVPTQMFVAYVWLRCRWEHQPHEIVLCRVVSPQLYVWLFFRDIGEYFSVQYFQTTPPLKDILSSVSPIVLWLPNELERLQSNDMDYIRSLDLLVKTILALYGATSDLAVRGIAEDNFKCR
ncbi:hypothetical protein BDV35DRAFT_399078 [Aspergillus flavus]|uniref:Uncharacterized protein n=1 Tax=Aspergillus flavus TaxID=5059 RepID=A0A5N6GC36_ASPFL|nr:hypothetical protein BDV35DRAFT_399078 [Aspergillus flavus]